MCYLATLDVQRCSMIPSPTLSLYIPIICITAAQIALPMSTLHYMLISCFLHTSAPFPPYKRFVPNN